MAVSLAFCCAAAVRSLCLPIGGVAARVVLLDTVVLVR